MFYTIDAYSDDVSCAIMHVLSHCCHSNMEGKGSHICELADMYLHNNNNLVDCKFQWFTNLKVSSLTLQKLWPKMARCIQNPSRRPGTWVCGTCGAVGYDGFVSPTSPTSHPSTPPASATSATSRLPCCRDATKRLGERENACVFNFNHVSSFLFRSFQRGTPEDLELPFQFLRMYSSIADPTVRTCGWESDFHMFERIWRCHGMPDVQFSYIVSCDPPRTF